MTVPPDAHVELSMEMPAIHVNRFLVRIGPDITRITFAEAAGPGAPQHGRVAITMPTKEALELARTLQQTAEQLKQQISAVTGAGTHGERAN